MTITKFRVGLAALFVLGIAALFVIVGRAANTLPPGEYDLEAGQYVFNVPELQDTPVPPTDTPIPPTDTPVPPLHDDRAWHPVSADISHEHKANPHLIDDIFGTEIYSWAGGEISYLWQTFKGAGEGYPPPPPPGQGDLENEFKHEQYGWSIGRNIGMDDCRTPPLCVTDFRIQYHFLAAAPAATHRFHSFWAEVRACNVDTGVCGIIRTGGHHDYGKLKIDNVFIDLPGDPTQLNGATRNHFHDLGNGGKIAYWISVTSTRGANPNMGFQVISRDAWDLIDPADLYALNFHCPDFDCEQNNSNVAIQQIRFDVPEELAVDGVVNFSGHTDRHGNIVECSEIGTDCVPFEIQNLEPGRYFTFEMSGVYPGGTEFDISPPGEWWIEYPN